MTPLARAAFVGIAKAPADWQTADSPPAQLVAGWEPAIDPESRLLLQAGADAIYRAAGRQATSASRLEAAPAEQGNVAPGSIVPALAKGFSTEFRSVLPEFLQQLAKARLSLPCNVLPNALNTTSPALRVLIAPVLGERGRWLSQFQPIWDWARPTLPADASEHRESWRTAWTEGAFSERVAALAHVREHDPGLARDWVSEVWNQEKADQRQRLLEIFPVGLSDDDLPFLEQALRDRAQGVRRAAASLLSQLPASSVSERHRQRAAGLFEFKQDSQGRMRLECRPPHDVDADWGTDGLEIRSREQQGERSVWVQSLISVVPLEFWTEQFSLSPVELMNGLRTDPYVRAVVNGWIEALLRSQIPESERALWRRALWDRGISAAQQRELPPGDFQQLGLLLAGIASTEVESYFVDVMSLMLNVPDAPAADLLNALPGPWPVPVSEAYLTITRKLWKARNDGAAMAWRATLSVAAIHLSPETFPAALEPWELKPDSQQTWQAASHERDLIRFGEVVRLRQSFYDGLRTSTN